MSKVAGERYVYKFIDTEAICQFNPELVSVAREHNCKANINLAKSRPSKSSRYQPYVQKYTTNSTPPSTTVVHHPITINQLSYEINSTNNFILNEAAMAAGLSVSTSYVSHPATSAAKSADVSSTSSVGSSLASTSIPNSSYYQPDSPKSSPANTIATSTPNCVNNYYKYQTPVVLLSPNIKVTNLK